MPRSSCPHAAVFNSVKRVLWDPLCSLVAWLINLLVVVLVTLLRTLVIRRKHHVRVCLTSSSSSADAANCRSNNNGTTTAAGPMYSTNNNNSAAHQHQQLGHHSSHSPSYSLSHSFPAHHAEATHLSSSSKRKPTTSSSSFFSFDYLSFSPLLPLLPSSFPPPITHHNHNRPRKSLVLDLDETLVHSQLTPPSSPSSHCDIRLDIHISPHHPPTTFYVSKRPYLDVFLRTVAQWYDITIFTASLQKYGDPLITVLDVDRVVKRRIFRQHCVMRNGNFVKDLTIVNPNLKDVIIVDNSPAAYASQPSNAIPIQAWYCDQEDEELLSLLPLLHALAFLNDVRSLLDLRLTGGALVARKQQQQHQQQHQQQQTMLMRRPITPPSSSG